MIQEERIDQLKAITKRECGECSLCCRLLDVPEIGKPRKGWCRHAVPGKGCAIYADRPPVCKGYACNWLMTPTMPDYWAPLNAKMILDFSISENKEILFPDLRIHLHPSHPKRWREKPYYNEILWLAKSGLEGKGGPFRGRYQTVIVRESKHLFIVLPDKVIPWSCGVCVFMNKWEFLPTKNEEQAVKLNTMLNTMNDAVHDIHRRYPEYTAEQRLYAVLEELKLRFDHDDRNGDAVKPIGADNDVPPPR